MTLDGTTSTSWRVNSSPSIPIIVLLGAPASGKGTLGALLAQDMGLYHLSVGDWLRELCKPPQTGCPSEIKEYMDRRKEVPDEIITAHFGKSKIPSFLLIHNYQVRGELLPPEVRLPLLAETIQDIENSGSYEGILLDGFPREVSHARAARKVFGQEFPSVAIQIDCNKQVAMDRYLSRARGDDDVAMFMKRYARYERENPDVEKFFAEDNRLIVHENAASAEVSYAKLFYKLANFFDSRERSNSP